MQGNLDEMSCREGWAVAASRGKAAKLALWKGQPLGGGT